MKTRLVLVPLVLTAVIVSLVLFQVWVSGPVAQAAVETSEPHMEVESEQTCDDCHMEETPEVVQAWYAGKHGVNNVKCFVCHGSTGSDFSTQVSMDRCVGCHADHVDAMKTSFMAKKTCFSCHPQHELNPHVQQVQGGVQ